MAGLALFLCWISAAPFWLAEILVYGLPLAYLVARFKEVRAALDPRFLIKAIIFSPVCPAPHTKQTVYGVFLVGLAIALLPPLRAVMDDYVYLKIGLLIYPPILFLAIRLGAARRRELLCTGLVFFLHLGFELVAMAHGYWGFQGDYLGWVHLAGPEIPLEELVFILLLSSSTAVAIHAPRFGWKSIATPAWPA